MATRNRSCADEVVLSHSATVPCNFLDFFDMFLGRICSPGVTPDMKDGVPGRYRVLWSLVCGVHCTGNRSALTIFDSCLLGQRQCVEGLLTDMHQRRLLLPLGWYCDIPDDVLHCVVVVFTNGVRSARSIRPFIFIPFRHPFERVS